MINAFHDQINSFCNFILLSKVSPFTQASLHTAAVVCAHIHSFMCVCVRTCVHMCAQAYTDACVCVCTWKPEVNSGYLPQLFST